MLTLGVDPLNYETMCQKNQIKYVNIPIFDEVDLDPEKCMESAKKLKELID